MDGLKSLKSKPSQKIGDLWRWLKFTNNIIKQHTAQRCEGYVKPPKKRTYKNGLWLGLTWFNNIYDSVFIIHDRLNNNRNI